MPNKYVKSMPNKDVKSIPNKDVKSIPNKDFKSIPNKDVKSIPNKDAKNSTKLIDRRIGQIYILQGILFKLHMHNYLQKLLLSK